jgi:hypothetical protein
MKQVDRVVLLYGAVSEERLTLKRNRLLLLFAEQARRKHGTGICIHQMLVLV